MIIEEISRKERAHKALVKVGILEKDGSLTKRSWITLLLIGNCYLFILLFSFLLGNFGETAVALMVFACGILVFRKVSSLQRELTERSK